MGRLQRTADGRTARGVPIEMTRNWVGPGPWSHAGARRGRVSAFQTRRSLGSCVIRGVLLVPLSFRDADRLAMIWQTDRATGTTREPASIPDYADIDARAATLQSTAAFTAADVNVTPETGDDPFCITALSVSASFFPTLGVEPLAGPLFAEDDRPGSAPVVVIGERLWEERFGRDPAVTRQPLRINDVPHAIPHDVPQRVEPAVARPRTDVRVTFARQSGHACEVCVEDYHHVWSRGPASPTLGSSRNCSPCHN
jgi:hypothetical protein